MALERLPIRFAAVKLLANLGSILSMFYKQLLHAQIPKAQKWQSSCQSFIHFWELWVQKLLIECWWNWHLPSISSLFMCSFYAHTPQSVRTQSSCQYLFTLLGPAIVNASCRMLMKLTPCLDEAYTKKQETLLKWWPTFHRLARKLLNKWISIRKLRLSVW